MKRISNLFTKPVWASLILTLYLSIPVSLSAQSQPLMIKDLNETALGSYSFVLHITALEQTALFLADDGEHGRELWKSDGTEAGTVLVKDINPGSGSSNTYYVPPININGTVFFFIRIDGGTTFDLWKTDGTEAGTVLLKEMSSYPYSLTKANGLLFFFVQQWSPEGDPDYQLWKSDGTEAGTALVNDFNPWGYGSIGGLTGVGDTLYFVIDKYPENNIEELWKTDGTAAGTTKVIDFDSELTTGAWISNLTDRNGTLFFTLQERDSSGGNDLSSLWKSDGTATGTVKIKDINPNYESFWLNTLTAVNDTLFFIVSKDFTGIGVKNELWKSDGTEVGTIKVKDINPNFEPISFHTMTASGEKLFFAVRHSLPDGTQQNTLWVSNGTEAGTNPIREDINLDLPRVRKSLADINGTIFFRATEPVHGTELWKSDGTEAGTVLVKDIFPGLGGAMPFFITNVNGTLFFKAIDPLYGQELWKSDGTEAGTVLVKDILPGSGGSSPNNYILSQDWLSGNTLFFTAVNYTSDGFAKAQLWKIYDNPFVDPSYVDFPDPGVHLVKEFYDDSGPRYINKLVAVNNGLLFFVETPKPEGQKNELWKTDGTESGTSLIKDISPSSGYLDVNQIQADNYNLYYVVHDYLPDGSVLYELWRSDGTVAGTYQLKTTDSEIHLLATSNDTLLFSLGNELWRSDGTQAGTAQVKSFLESSPLINGSCLYAGVNGGFFFWVNSYPDLQLWKSDGTEAGTVQVSNFSSDGWPHMTNVNGTLFFNIEYFNSEGGYRSDELWRTDGTEAGTVLVKDLYSDLSETSIMEMSEANDALFFVLRSILPDNNSLYEIWQSDGTEAGTNVVKTFESNQTINQLTNVKDTLFFRASDYTHGDELWKSDGTEAGTVLVHDIFPGDGGSSPSNLTPFKNNMVFSAKGWMTGHEPFILDMTNPISSINLWNGRTVQGGSRLLVGGTAGDDFTGVSDVEVSVDGGNSWISTSPECDHYCFDWSYDWLTPTTGGTFQVSSRAIDLANNVEIPTNTYFVNVLPVMHTLNVTVNGPGRVNSDPIDVNCVDNCTQEYVDGTDVILYSSYDTGVTFSGWTGGCSGIDDCTLTMDGSKSVTANYYQNSNNPVILEGLPGNFTTIQLAYNSIASGQLVTMKVKAGDQASGDLMFNRDVTIKLEGGYDQAFINILGDTSFYGTLTITDGTATISNLVIK